MKAEISVIREGSCTSLIVGGDLTAQNGKRLKTELHQLHQEKGKHRLSFKNIESVDVSAIQLINEFKLRYASSPGALDIVLPEREEVVELLRKTGLLPILQ